MAGYTRFLLSAVIAAACAGCSSLVNSFAFHPTDDGMDDVSRYGAGIVEKQFTSADDVPLHAYYLPNGVGDKVVVFFHGNYGNSTQRLSQAVSLRELGVSVFLLSYRGYPKSGGSPSERGIYLDGRAALDVVTSELGYTADNTFLLGRSIGSAVAVEIAQDRSLAGLILVSPISSGKDVAKQNGMGWASWLIGNPFDSAGKFHRLTSPVLIIHGAEDNILPVQMGRTLYEAAPAGSTFVQVPGAGHNDLLSTSGRCYWQWISAFIHRSETPSQSGDARCIRGTMKQE